MLGDQLFTMSQLTRPPPTLPMFAFPDVNRDLESSSLTTLPADLFDGLDKLKAL